MNSAFPIFPSADDFTAAFARNQPQLIWTKWISDLDTPVSSMLKLYHQQSPCFLLESVQGGEVRGRYSIIGLEPDLIWKCRGKKAEINTKGTIQESDFVPCKEDSITSLKKLVRESTLTIPDALPPMAAGLIGFMGYDMVKLMERLPDNNPDAIGLPDSVFMRPQVMVIFDSVIGEVFIVTPVWKDQMGTSSPEQIYESAVKRIEAVSRKLRTPLPQESMAKPIQSTPIAFTPHLSKEAYYTMVDKAKEYIAAGDIFQVVPSQRFEAPFTLPPFSLYRAIRHLNPSPFLFFLHFCDFSMIGSSPEILVRLRDDKVTIRPIAGTRKRGATTHEDQELKADLLADPKEIAEHLMLLDLGRNDVGRIAKTGTVKVTDHMQVELYSHVMHIVSNVEGEIDPRFDAIDALIAGFPAGTVSGAPKIRAMEIIDELESERRSFYAGCVGYFSAGGSMDTCITLRTGLIKDGKLYVQAGGGVVADSDPHGEYMESANKAKAIMRAAEEAVRFV
jgi:anthranilate synthase component 1